MLLSLCRNHWSGKKWSKQNSININIFVLVDPWNFSSNHLIQNNAISFTFENGQMCCAHSTYQKFKLWKIGNSNKNIWIKIIWKQTIYWICGQSKNHKIKQSIYWICGQSKNHKIPSSFININITNVVISNLLGTRSLVNSIECQFVRDTSCSNVCHFPCENMDNLFVTGVQQLR